MVEVAIQRLDSAGQPVRTALDEIARSLDLGLFDDVEAGQFLLGGCREEMLETALALLAERCPLQYSAGAIQAACVASIFAAADVTHAYKRQQGGSGAFASVELGVRPGGSDCIEFLDECPEGNLPTAYRAAIADAILRGDARSWLGWPLAAVTVSLKDGKYHDLDSSPEAFAIATREALRLAVDQGGMKVLEPVVSIAVLAPSADLDACARLLRRRGVDFETMRGNDAGSLSASSRMSDLLGFAAELREASSRRADFAIILTGYVEIAADRGSPGTEPVAAALRA